MFLSPIFALLRTNAPRTLRNINVNQHLFLQVKWNSSIASSKNKIIQEKIYSDSDSDDDWDSCVEKGKSEFWRRKMRTFHGILDINKDGVISFDDFKILVDRFIYLGHLDLHQQKEFNEVVQNIWEERWGTISPYNLVTTEQYLEDMHHVVNDRELRQKVHNFLPYLFKAVDKDKSGYITAEEFKLFFNCLGLPKEVALVSFTAVDEDLDGRVTLKEFVKTGRDFFLTEDQRKPSKLFWGPLVK
ncbi:sarcoplasmic calcium-binding protein [Halyomorpha halys]|uniref:sarcoplasmic calcium-binding protein n=1 Tax=Halyomorpha halys TaxID=286706 RepID=UPI0006D4D4F0|nr:sarcoplasmic calcium-binding protein [Halyomorpha halys]